MPTTSERSSAMHELAELFLASKTASGFCRSIAMHSKLGISTIGSELLVVNQDATLRTLAYFGKPLSTIGQAVSLWEVGLIAEAARTSTLTKGMAKDPETNEDVFIYCYPCATPSQTTGVFVLLKNAEVDVELSEVDQKTMMLMGALWLETMGITNFKDQASSSDGDPSDLTTRQLEILQQIAAGKTNAQIALEQILSESTIRQETVRIYHSLSVGGRVEATKRAIHLGLVDRVAV